MDTGEDGAKDRLRVLGSSIARAQRIVKTQARERNELMRTLATEYGWTERDVAAAAGVSAAFAHKVLSEE